MRITFDDLLSAILNNGAINFDIEIDSDNLFEDKFKLENCSNYTGNGDMSLKFVKDNYHYKISDLLKFCTNLSEDQKENFICSVCNELLYPPITLSCGHSFCKFCIDEQKKHTDKCPLCRSANSFENLFTNISLKNIIDCFDSECPSCSWTGKISDLYEHYQICNKLTEVVKCKYCDETKGIDKILEHLVNDCVHKSIQCKYCKTSGPRIYQEEHEMMCDKKNINCDKCSKNVNICLIDQHMKYDCKYRKIKCKYCSKKIIYNKINQHNRVCSDFFINCRNCNQNIKRKNIKQHNERCLDK